MDALPDSRIANTLHVWEFCGRDELDVDLSVGRREDQGTFDYFSATVIDDESLIFYAR